MSEEGILGTTPVMSYESNAFGVHDMIGNVMEWCSDKYEPNFYLLSPEEDPQGAEKSTHIVVRGGSWYVATRLCRTAYRYRITPDYKFKGLGFRVVKIFVRPKWNRE